MGARRWSKGNSSRSTPPPSPVKKNKHVGSFFSLWGPFSPCGEFFWGNAPFPYNNVCGTHALIGKMPNLANSQITRNLRIVHTPLSLIGLFLLIYSLTLFSASPPLSLSLPPSIPPLSLSLPLSISLPLFLSLSPSISLSLPLSLSPLPLSHPPPLSPSPSLSLPSPLSLSFPPIYLSLSPRLPACHISVISTLSVMSDDNIT